MLLDVGNQFVGELAIGEPAVAFVRLAAPRAGVHFVNRHWRMEPVARGARCQPRGVVPFVAVDVANHRRRLRPQLRREAVRIGLQSQVVIHARENFEFVERAFVELRHEDFPDAARAASAHRIRAAVPEIEVAHHAHALRVRRPDGEMHAAHARHFAHVRAQFFVFLVMRAFARKIQIVIGEQRREGVRVERLERVAVGEMELDAISVRAESVRRGAVSSRRSARSLRKGRRDQFARRAQWRCAPHRIVTPVAPGRNARIARTRLPSRSIQCGPRI